MRHRRSIFWVALAGTATGVVGAVLGTGGGVLLIPILVIGLDMPMHQAIATSIVSVIATSSAVASVNVKRGSANMRLGMTLEVATVLGAVTGGLTAGRIAAENLGDALRARIAPGGRADVARAGAMRKDGSAEETAPRSESIGRLGARYHDPSEDGVVAYRVRRLWAGLLISFVAGNLSGLLGVGGGVFKVPALHLACAVPIKAAAATSNFMIGVTAAASATLYYGRGEVRAALTAATILGVLVGSILGMALNRRLRSGMVRKVFAVLLLAAAGEMLYRTFVEG